MLENIESKICSLDEFIAWKEKTSGTTIATNGVFDLLHPGHMHYLAEASALGDSLVIALNSDSSVKELKDPRRPIISENDRAFMLASLECVDKVVIFQEKEALNTLLKISPDIYVKGGDYTLDTINQNERRSLEKNGTEIRILSFKHGFSTTQMIDRIVSSYG